MEYQGDGQRKRIPPNDRCILRKCSQLPSLRTNKVRVVYERREPALNESMKKMIPRCRHLRNNNAPRTKRKKSTNIKGSKGPVDRQSKRAKSIKQLRQASSQPLPERKRPVRSTKKPRSKAIKTSRLHRCSFHYEIFHLGQRKSSATAVPPESAAANDQTIVEPEAKQYIFPKRDRTTSLMALQTLAKKIAQCEEWIVFFAEQWSF